MRGVRVWRWNKPLMKTQCRLYYIELADTMDMCTPLVRKLRIKAILPDLMLQEAHVAVEQCIWWWEDPDRFHPGTPLCRVLHRHVCEAGQAKVGALAEVAAVRRERETHKKWVTEREGGLPDGLACSGRATLSLQSGGVAFKYSKAN